MDLTDNDLVADIFCVFESSLSWQFSADLEDLCIKQFVMGLLGEVIDGHGMNNSSVENRTIASNFYVQCTSNRRSEYVMLLTSCTIERCANCICSTLLTSCTIERCAECICSALLTSCIIQRLCLLQSIRNINTQQFVSVVGGRSVDIT